MLVDFDRCAPMRSVGRRLSEAAPAALPRSRRVLPKLLSLQRPRAAGDAFRKEGVWTMLVLALRPAEGTLLLGVRKGEFSPISEDPLVFVGPNAVAPARAYAMSQPRNDMLLFFGAATKRRIDCTPMNLRVSALGSRCLRSRDIRTLVRDATTKALRARSGDVASWILDRMRVFISPGMRKWPRTWRWRYVIVWHQMRWLAKGGGAVEHGWSGRGASRRRRARAKFLCVFVSNFGFEPRRCYSSAASRGRESAARAARRDSPIPFASGWVPPSTRRATRSVVLERRHSLAEIVERGACVKAERPSVIFPHLECGVDALLLQCAAPRGIALRSSDLASSKRRRRRRVSA